MLPPRRGRGRGGGSYQHTPGSSSGGQGDFQSDVLPDLVDPSSSSTISSADANAVQATTKQANNIKGTVFRNKTDTENKTKEAQLINQGLDALGPPGPEEWDQLRTIAEEEFKKEEDILKRKALMERYIKKAKHMRHVIYCQEMAIQAVKNLHVAIAGMNAYSDICARKELDLSGQTNQEGDHPEALRKNQRVVTLGELEHYCSEAEVVLQHHSISPDVPIEHYYEPDELKISFCVEHDSVSLALWIDPEDWPILRPTSVEPETEPMVAQKGWKRMPEGQEEVPSPGIEIKSPGSSNSSVPPPGTFMQLLQEEPGCSEADQAGGGAKAKATQKKMQKKTQKLR